jgi:hypothetical protein
MVFVSQSLVSQARPIAGMRACSASTSADSAEPATGATVAGSSADPGVGRENWTVQ